jgi:signal transduction histidine kinase
MGTLAGASGFEDFCRSLFEATEDGCFFARLLDAGEDPVEWSILAVNAAFEQRSGLQHLAGRTLSEGLPWFRESAPDLLAAFRRVAGGGPRESLGPLAGPLAAWGSAEVLSPGPGQVIARFRALPAGLPGEGALDQQESFIRSILDHLPIGIAVNGPDPVQNPTYMNDLFPKTYRTTRAALGGSAATPGTFWEQAYEDPAMRESIKARVLADLSSGDPARLHWERLPLTRQGEETTFIDARNIPLPGTSMMISTVWDVTELVRQEAAARLLQEQLQQIQNLESLGLLAGGVAHDINNVLGAILAVATVHQRRAEAGSPLRRDMETIAQACLRGGALVKSLLGFASTGLHDPGFLDLNDLVREEVRRLERSPIRGLRIRGELSQDLRRLKGDPVALAHALTSLSLNATEAMPQGGTLSFRTRNDGADAVLLEIKDSGAGMAPEVLQQALTPFYTTKQATTGTGLGLSIVYGTVRAHRGTLDLQSEPGRGTLVRLRFPALDPQGEDAKP